MMEFDSPQTISSESKDVITVGSSSRSPLVANTSTSEPHAAAAALGSNSMVNETVNSSQRSATIEHIVSTPRSTVSSEELDVLEARAEAARAAQQAAEARLRYLEARSRSSRTSQASRSSRRQGRDGWDSVLDPRNRINPDDIPAMNFEHVLPIDTGAGVGPLEEPPAVTRQRGDRRNHERRSSVQNLGDQQPAHDPVAEPEDPRCERWKSSGCR